MSDAERLAVGTKVGGVQPTSTLARVGLIAALLLPVAYGALGVWQVTRAPSVPHAVQYLIPVAIGVLLVVMLAREGRRSREARAAAADSEYRFRTAVEAARCGVWEWDLENDSVYLSEVMGVMLGWGGGGEVTGGEVMTRIAPQHRERVRKGLEDAARHGAFDVSFRVPSATPGGRSSWIDVRGQATGQPTDGVFTQLIGVAIDVTEERQADARAQAAETRLRDAIDSVSEAFVLFDARGRLLLSNRTFRELFGLEPRLLKPGVAKDTLFQFVNHAIERESPPLKGRETVREVKLHDGRWVQINERRTADGGLVVTGANITAIKTQEEARRRNEEALTIMVAQLEEQQAELADLARKYEGEKLKAEGASKAKGDFLANMSHELRTPLNAINGFSEIMIGELYGPLGDERYREYASDILASGQHLLALINDVLDMSKIEAGKMKLRPEPVHVEDVAEDVVRLLRTRAEAGRVALEVDLARVPETESDYRAVKQILLNLVSNAIKFTHPGGLVRITGATTGARLRVSVIDTGIGIAKADLERLAKPFEQVETEHSRTNAGTGLGLALTKSLVELHGGVLEIESEPGQGTTVSFSLPLRTRTEATPPVRLAA